jgi:hypothetical protein
MVEGASVRCKYVGYKVGGGGQSRTSTGVEDKEEEAVLPRFFYKKKLVFNVWTTACDE